MTDKSTAIKKGGQGDATLLQPTVMAAVPLVLDRVRKAITEQVESRGPFFAALFDFAIDYKRFWMKKGFGTPLMHFLVCRKIRQLLGGKITYIFSGSAPLSPETHDFIRSCLDITLVQGYGLTETTAGGAVMDLSSLATGRVGPPIKGVKIKLSDWAEGNYYCTDKPNPRGEIVISGKCVTAGYFKNEQLTKECFKVEDGETWFYTGDIGEFCSDGSVKIIDRKKDLVKLQFGEYISLGKVETELKSCPYVDNVCIYGDSYHNYVVALVVPNPKSLENLAKQLGLEHTPFKSLCQNQAVVRTITKAIYEHGIKSKLNKMEIPQKVYLVSEDWSPDSGLVTAALKLRRKNIQEHYKLEIQSLYDVQNGSGV